jgi:hypothetical protein
MMSTQNSSDKACQLREKQAAELEMPIRWSNNASRGLQIRRNAIEPEKKKKQSANSRRRNNAVKVITRQ